MSRDETTCHTACSNWHLILNGAGIVLSLLMIVISILIYTWDASQPPLHVVPDMDFQPRYRAQQASSMFSDGRGMRTPPAGTVARGHLKEDRAFYEAVVGDSDPATLVADPWDSRWVDKIPATVDETLVARGRQRFDIFCAACHGPTGDGVSEVSRFMMPRPKNLHGELDDQGLRDFKTMPDGYLFHVISRGSNTMQGYADQISEADRWAIVAYLRALQRCTQVSVEASK